MTSRPRLKVVALLVSLLSLSLFVLGDNHLGEVPAMAPLLSPFEGFWQNAEALDQDQVPTLQSAYGLEAPVTIRLDSALVPHVEAITEHDLFFAQGFTQAALRLWQMDFIARVAAGRVSEVVGDRALEFDRFQRRIGMVYAAEQAQDSMLKNPVTMAVLYAYTDGVNAYLAQLTPRRYPLEFKIFGYAPEPWTPLKTCLILKYMAYSLTGASDDAAMSRALALLGPQAVADLYPDRDPYADPVIPRGTRPDFVPLARPRPDTSMALPFARSLPFLADPANGSNNWALAGKRTKSGKPLLANDPHLNLTLPSIWMQMQLSCPSFEACGVSIPGTPCLIVGYNRAIAWGVTNADADVMDHYQIRYTSPARSQYLYAGKSLPVRTRIEAIRTRDGEIILDTVRYTHLGPVAYEGAERPFNTQYPIGTAVRWAAHEASNELMTFYKLCHGRGYADYTSALRHMACPAQNFVYADSAGNVALWVQGRFPLKWKGQGKAILDGSRPGHAWGGYIPPAQNPHTLNPERGYVSSANQQSVDSLYPYYLNWRQAGSERGRAINTYLGRQRQATPDAMAALQADDESLLARDMLPGMLAAINRKSLSPPAQETITMLSEWNYRMDSSEIAATVFDAWFRALEDTLWDEVQGRGLPGVSRSNTCAILKGNRSPWLDVSETPEREDAPALFKASYIKAFATLTARLGAAGQAWAWGRAKHTQIGHIARIPGLGLDFISCSGGPGTVNATGATHGPSWRMVVDLKSPVKGYGILPGGQSGNPGSPFYADQVASWRMGKLQPLHFYGMLDREHPGQMALWRLVP